jgi:hypothetical protein
VDANAGQTAWEPVLRSEPDATRKAVSTSVAADRYKLSRFYVAKLVQQGKIDGYGVRRHEGSRTRWYVYADALPDGPEATDSACSSSREQELLKCLLDAREHSRLARRERDQAERLLTNAFDAMADALRATHEGDQNRTFSLLLVVHDVRNDEKRRLITAQQHEADAEACLDAAFRSLLPSAKGVEAYARDHVINASSGGATAPVVLDSGSTSGSNVAL